MKENYNINMGGDQYLKYLRYKDERKIEINKTIFKHFKKFRLSYYLILCSLILYVVGQSWIDSFFYVEKQIHWVYYYGFAFPDYGAWVLLIIVGFAWLLHGVGFFIVKG